MDITQINDRFSVTPQIAAAQMQAIREAGFAGIICNRPDGEAPDQPGFAEIEAAARAAGIGARYVPVVPGADMSESLADFGRAIAELPGPVLAYCRSGARSTAMWTLYEAAQAEG